MPSFKTLAVFAFVLISSLFLEASGQQQFDQLPQDTFGEYQTQSCCPPGFNVAGEYCVRCAEPAYWNPFTQKCVTCDPNEPWNPTTHMCECCPAPRTVQAGKCACPFPKT